MTEKEQAGISLVLRSWSAQEGFVKELKKFGWNNAWNVLSNTLIALTYVALSPQGTPTGSKEDTTRAFFQGFVRKEVKFYPKVVLPKWEAWKEATMARIRLQGIEDVISDKTSACARKLDNQRLYGMLQQCLMSTDVGYVMLMGMDTKHGKT